MTRLGEDVGCRYPCNAAAVALLPLLAQSDSAFSVLAQRS